MCPQITFVGIWSFLWPQPTFWFGLVFNLKFLLWFRFLGAGCRWHQGLCTRRCSDSKGMALMIWILFCGHQQGSQKYPSEGQPPCRSQLLNPELTLQVASTRIHLDLNENCRGFSGSLVGGRMKGWNTGYKRGSDVFLLPSSLSSLMVPFLYQSLEVSVFSREP